MKQKSSIGEVETWLEGIMTYKSETKSIRQDEQDSMTNENQMVKACNNAKRGS